MVIGLFLELSSVILVLYVVLNGSTLTKQEVAEFSSADHVASVRLLKSLWSLYCSVVVSVDFNSSYYAAGC